MCGFVAVIGPGPKLPKFKIEKMRDKLSHRGPDGAGYWSYQNEKGSVSFGFRRLAIVEPRNSSANQPFLSDDKSISLVFNGEIYNFLDLRSELVGLGHVFKTASDTEVLMRGYIEWGKNITNKLNGMFAFIFWDKNKDEIFCARDRFGEKPLFITSMPDGVIMLASEMKALLAHDNMSQSLNYELLSHSAMGNSISAFDETVFSNINQVRPATSFSISISGERGPITEFWKPHFYDDLALHDTKTIIDQVEHLLVNSIAKRAGVDVPTASLLSGGLDSSLICSIINQLQSGGSNPVSLLASMRFPHDKDIDEGVFIEAVRENLNLPFEDFTCDVENLFDDIRNMHWHHEGVLPGPSMYLEWHILKTLKERGIKVVLDGQGGDEVFLGYTEHFRAFQFGLLFTGMRGIFQSYRAGNARDKELNFAAQKYTNAERRFSTRERIGFSIFMYMRGSLPKLQSRFQSRGMPVFGNGQEKALSLVRSLNLFCTSLPQNLWSGDRNSMAHGVENRFPFLDYELFDFVCRIPEKFFIEEGWSKELLRKVGERRLVKDVVRRPDKVGFSAPSDAWMLSRQGMDWLAERLYDPSLKDLPEYSQNVIVNDFEKFKEMGNISDATKLWRWASAAEFIDLKASGTWNGSGYSEKPIVINTKRKSPIEIAPLRGRACLKGNKTATQNKLAWIISFTPVNKEPRVLRQASTLRDNGWDVTIVGFDGNLKENPSYRYVYLDQAQLDSNRRFVFIILFKLLLFLRICGILLSRFGVFPGVKVRGATLAQKFTWSYWLYSKVIRWFFEDFPQLKPNAVFCHDYFTADIGLEIGRKAGAACYMDCHEYAVEQYDSSSWKKIHAPQIFWYQKKTFEQFNSITVVSKHIGNLINRDYPSLKNIREIKSLPIYSKQVFNPTKEIITVLYHGEIWQPRAIDVLIESVSYWQSHFRLVVRGYAVTEYLERCKKLAETLRVSDRVSFEAPVEFAQIIPEANKADIGIFVQRQNTFQQKLALPNKVFEYNMAGLALVLNNTEGFQNIIEKHNNGVLISRCDPICIADAINSLSHEDINKFKINSLEAAKKLNWDFEKERFLASLEGDSG